MFQLLGGVIFAVSGVVFYWLGTMPKLLGTTVSPSGIHHATGVMWGTALVMFMWFIHDRRTSAARPHR